MKSEKPSESRIVPGSLDLNVWLAFSLASSNEIERRLALDEIDYQGLAKFFVDDLNRRSRTDTSKICRDLSDKLLQDIKGSPSDQLVESIELTPERVNALFRLNRETRQKVIQASLRKPPKPEVLDNWRSYLNQENDPEVIRIGLSLLARFGCHSDTSLAVPFINHTSALLVKTVIDLIHAHNRTMFKNCVAQFLSSDDLDIRIHAIRKLRSFEPESVKQYLRSLLLHPDPFTRQRALRELLLLPASESESLYLACLAVEPLPILLVFAGAAMAVNPSPDLPQKLFDVFSAARGMRSHVLHLILLKILNAFKASGIIQETIQSYLGTLKATQQKRNLWVTTKMALIDLDNSETDIRLAAIRKLKQSVFSPKVRKALEQRRSIETVQQILDTLDQALGGELESYSIEGLRSRIKDGTFYSLDARLQNNFLDTINDENSFLEIRPVLTHLFAATLEKSVLVRFFECIATHGQGLNPKPLFRYLKSSDSDIQAASLRAIAKLDFDSISYEIPSLMRHSDNRVQIAALELYMQTDKISALSYLETMLKAPQGKVRKNALSLLLNVEPSWVKDILHDFFPAEKNLEIKLKAGYILASNPNLENLQLLYSGTHDEKGVINESFKELWDSILENSIPLLAPDEASLKASCQERIKQAASAGEAAYSFEKVSGLSRKNIYGKKDIVQSENSFFYSNLPYVLVILVTMGLGMFLMRNGGGSSQGISGHLPVVVHENLSSRMSEGKRDMPSLVTGQRGSNASFLSGKSYSSIMKSMHQERQAISEEFHRKNQEEFKKVIQQMSEDPEYIGCAEFYLDKNCSGGLAALEQGKLHEARDFLLKALDDPAVSEEAKIMVCQSLMAIGFQIGDKDCLQKALEAFLATIPENELPKGYDKASIKNVFEGLNRIKDMSPDQFMQQINAFAPKFPKQMTPETIKTVVDGYQSMQERFKK
ncbi:MAG: HEAT repeat domain-containing protein [Candidatus Riflebacteria bacterium]|nr:HEAT repeat domain-containing protein [Candidatus Riflebacteria bacterium]